MCYTHRARFGLEDLFYFVMENNKPETVGHTCHLCQTAAAINHCPLISSLPNRLGIHRNISFFFSTCQVCISIHESQFPRMPDRDTSKRCRGWYRPLQASGRGFVLCLNNNRTHELPALNTDFILPGSQVALPWTSITFSIPDSVWPGVLLKMGTQLLEPPTLHVSPYAPGALPFGKPHQRPPKYCYPHAEQAQMRSETNVSLLYLRPPCRLLSIVMIMAFTNRQEHAHQPQELKGYQAAVSGHARITKLHSPEKQAAWTGRCAICSERYVPF